MKALVRTADFWFLLLDEVPNTMLPRVDFKELLVSMDEEEQIFFGTTRPRDLIADDYMKCIRCGLTKIRELKRDPIKYGACMDKASDREFTVMNELLDKVDIDTTIDSFDRGVDEMGVPRLFEQILADGSPLPSPPLSRQSSKGSLDCLQDCDFPDFPNFDELSNKIAQLGIPSAYERDDSIYASSPEDLPVEPSPAKKSRNPVELVISW